MKKLTPSDLLLIVIVVAGILLALFVDIIAVKIIGIGLAIIFSVGLFMIIAQRQREFVASNSTKKPSSPNYKTTVKKDNTATRQTFEDFMDRSSEDDNKSPEETDFSSSNISGDEGFRIIKKNKSKPNEFKSEKSKAPEKDDSDENDDGKIHIKTKLKAEPKIEGAIEQANEKVESKKEEQVEIENESKKTEITTGEKQEEETIPEEKIEDSKEDNGSLKGIDLDSLIEDSPASDEPRLEFEYCVSKLLVSIRAVSSTRSACFFLMNNAKDNIKLESFATDVPNKLIKNIRYSIGSDLISSIIKNEKPEIVTEIQEESQLELLPYYSEEADIKSFIGVPVFYDRQVIGVICADSPLSDAYDSVMVNFLAQLNSLITTLLGSYIEKYDLQMAYKTLQAITIFREKQASEDNDIMWALLESCSQVVEVDSIGILVWNNENSKWFCGAEIGVTEHPLIKDLEMADSSLVNKAISNKEIVQKEIKTNDIILSSDEKLEEMGWVAILPVYTNNVVFGALVLLNSTQPDTDEEIQIAETLCQFSASSIERVQLLEMLSQNSLYDYDTGLMNRNAFEDSLNREFQRNLDSKGKFSVVLMNIDKYASFEPGVYQKRMEAMIYHVMKTTNKLKRDYDIFGKADDKLFGIILPEKDANTAKIWAEKLRSEVATSMINHESKKFNVTISLGVAENTSAETADELLSNSLQALKISLEKTNFVSLFS